jgi:hypothetical protein
VPPSARQTQFVIARIEAGVAHARCAFLSFLVFSMTEGLRTAAQHRSEVSDQEEPCRCAVTPC